MANLPPLVVQVIADTKQFQAGMATAGKSASGLSKMSAGLKAGFLIAGAAAIKFGVDSVKSFLEAERAAFLLEKAVERAGQASDGAAEAYMDQANSLQALTGFQDEAIMGAQAIFLRLGATEDQMRRLIPLTLDFARATGKDVPAAAQGIAKAIQGSTRALKEVGVTYVATGNRAKDLANVMDLLDQQVGGTATEFGTTLAGNIEIAQAKWDEFKESVGSIPGGVFSDLTGGATALSAAVEDVLIAEGVHHEAVEDAIVINERYSQAMDAAAASVGAFANMTISEFKDWSRDVAGEFSAAEGAMDKLGGKAHLTATQIINAFQRQAEALRNYDRNVQILASKPSVGEQMLKFLLEQGDNGIALINELATTHGAKYNQMIASIRAAMAADKAHRATVQGLKNDLQTLPSDVYSTIHISVVGGIPPGIGGGIGGPGPGGQTTSSATPTFSMPDAGKGTSTSTTKTITNVFQGPVYGFDDFERKVEEATNASLSRWEAV